MQRADIDENTYVGQIDRRDPAWAKENVEEREGEGINRIILTTEIKVLNRNNDRSIVPGSTWKGSSANWLGRCGSRRMSSDPSICWENMRSVKI